MNHEQQNNKPPRNVADEYREATARFAQELGRMAASAAASALAFVNVRALHEAAHTVFESAYENALRDAARIGEETRRSISLAVLSAPNMSAILAGLPGRAIAGEAFAASAFNDEPTRIAAAKIFARQAIAPFNKPNAC